ncbi:hypothetical protein [Metamycoplasma canadense]|uniref:Cell division protein FtsA n=1 Tax=Metamycoplasma canadense TaxID=29554 RepID=A0A077LCF1_9BACT|nr:hypothetical protein [Metamycoplasma canadense]BAP39764.1 hypothetical protein MCAN360_0734 [Metamycoplasma canadense]
MKKSIIVAYKFENNSFSIEAIEKKAYGNILIYKNSIKNTFFNLFQIDNFIKETKSELYRITKCQIYDVIVIIQQSSNLKIYNKTISKDLQKNNLDDIKLAEKLYLEQKKINLYLFDYSFIFKDNKKQLINLSMIDWDMAKNIFNLFKKNNLNVLRIYDYDFLKNVSIGKKNNNGVATFINLDNQSLKIEISKNNINIITKETNLGIDYLVNNIANVLKINYSQALIKLNLWSLNLHAGDSIKLDLIIRKYLILVENEITKIANQTRIDKDYLNINLCPKFNLFKKILLNDKSFYLNINHFNLNKNLTISNQMLGIVGLIDNLQNNTIKEMTITSELFVVNPQIPDEKKYSFNYKNN